MKRKIALISLVMLAALGGWRVVGADQEHPEKINFTEYYPLAGGNTWVYRNKQFRADGQIFQRLRTLVAADEVKVGDNVSARRMADDRGRYSLIAVNADSYRLFAENDGSGDVKFEPPLGFFNAANSPGKPVAVSITATGGEKFNAESTFFGVESVAVPAGAFKDCLKLRFTTTKPSGATVTTTRYLAKGVGLVKETQEVFSPAAGQSLRYETELMHGRIAGRKIGGEADQTVKVAEYFPFHQGDAWTYDWTYRLSNGQARTTERKRWFEGTKFTNAGAAFKLVQNIGDEDYQFYTLDRGGLKIIESGEKGTRAQGVKFYYEPGLLIARDDLVIGRTYNWSQMESDGKSVMQFATTLDGFENVETPMGRYENCLRVRVEWDTSTARVKNIYYYARGVGMVAYDYDVITKRDNTVLMTLSARVKAATINGNAVATAADAKKLWDKMAAELVVASEDPKARALFKEASLNRYVWDADLGFRGFTADVVLKLDGGAAIPIKVRCSPTLDIELDAPDANSKALMHEEMSQFVTHREPRKPFEAWYGPEKAKFKLGQETPEGQIIFVEGDSMGSNYVIANKQVRYLSRNMGRLEFTISNEKYQPAEDGRYIALEYGVVYHLAGTKQEVGNERFVDAYMKQGNYWVPKSRVHTSTMKGKPARIELEITKLEYLK